MPICPASDPERALAGTGIEIDHRPLCYAVPRLTRALTRDLFRGDLQHHWDDLKTFTGTEFGGYPVALSVHQLNKSSS